MYSKQANPIPLTSAQVPSDSVHSSNGEGRWMTMQQAIAATGLTERTLRRHLQKGWVKCRRTGKQRKSRVELWITPEIGNFPDQSEQDDQEDSKNVEIFDVDSDSIDGEVFDTTPESSNAAGTGSGDGWIRSTEIERIVSAVTGQFLQRLDKTNEMLFELRTELQDKDRQLKLLPDLQKQADERQLAELKNIALEKQIEELKLLNEKLTQKATEASEKFKLVEEKKSWWKGLFKSGSTTK